MKIRRNIEKTDVEIMEEVVKWFIGPLDRKILNNYLSYREDEDEYDDFSRYLADEYGLDYDHTYFLLAHIVTEQVKKERSERDSKPGYSVAELIRVMGNLQDKSMRVVIDYGGGVKEVDQLEVKEVGEKCEWGRTHNPNANPLNRQCQVLLLT